MSGAPDARVKFCATRDATADVPRFSSHLKRSRDKAALHSYTCIVENLSNFVLPWLKAIAKSDDVAADEIANLIVEICGAVVKM